MVVGRSARKGAPDRARARPRVLVLVLLAAADLVPTAGARALGVELDADASFQAYEVRTPGAIAFLARRRLVSSVALRLSEAFTEPDAEGRRIRLTASGRLRFEQDFGEDCLVGRELCVQATDPTDLGGYQPLAAITRLDVPTLWVAVDGLPYGIEARVGRMLEVDPIGFVRLDGGAVRAQPWSFLALEGSAGMVVRRTSLAGASPFEPLGSLRLELGEVDPLRASWVAPPSDTWTAQATLRASAGAAFAAAAGVRQTWDGDGTVLRRAWASASSSPHPLLRLEASGVLDLVRLDLVTGLLSAALHDDAFSVRVGFEHRVPRFDFGTIWAFFSTATTQTLSVSGSYRFGPDLELGGAVRGRRAELGAGARGNADPDDLDAGGELWGRARFFGVELDAAGFVWSGSLGPLAGVSLDAARALVREVGLELHVTLWNLSDPNRPELEGTIVTEALDATFQLADEARILLELSHAHSRQNGDRFRIVAYLEVHAWR